MPCLPDPPCPSNIKQRLAKLIDDLPESELLNFLQQLETRAAMNNRKGGLRRAFRIPVDCVEPSYITDGFILNMSADGIFIKTERPVPEGKEIELVFSVLNYEFPVRLIGRVVWGDTRGMGVQFKKIATSSYLLDVQKVVDAVRSRPSL